MFLKKRKEKDTNNPHYIPQISTLPLTKWSYTNSPPKYDYSYIQNYSPFLSQFTKGTRSYKASLEKQKDDQRLSRGQKESIKMHKCNETRCYG